MDTVELANEILEATVDLPSSSAIEGLLSEYLMEPSQSRRVTILIDILTVLEQDYGGPNAKRCVDLREQF